MKTMRLGQSNLQVPVIAVGCMRIKNLSNSEAENFIQTALEQGANFFDHADSIASKVDKTTDRS